MLKSQFQRQSNEMLNTMTDSNPNSEYEVRCMFYSFVRKLVRRELMIKINEMLARYELADFRQMMKDWNYFITVVR